jgi:hypothetical protein
MWTFEDTIRNMQHTAWLFPDGVHTRDVLRLTEPGRRDYDSPCPCGCGEGTTKLEEQA